VTWPDIQSFVMRGRTQGGEAISIVMPVFNEAPVIGEVTKEILREVVDALPGSELIIVNDCSTDETPGIIDAIAEKEPAVRIIDSPVNSGHGPSVVTGLEKATNDWILLIDSDAQIPTGEFWKLWDNRNETDLLLGHRVHRHDPTHRLVLAKTVRFAVSRLGGRRVSDPDVPFKLMRSEVWEDLAPYIDRTSLAPSIMIVLGALTRNWRIESVPIQHRARTHGRSTLRLGKLVVFSLRGLRQLVVFRSRLRAAVSRTSNPHSKETPSKIRG
jgi:dolichol-phosphate mannosyltransferase